MINTALQSAGHGYSRLPQPLLPKALPTVSIPGPRQLSNTLSVSDPLIPKENYVPLCK